MAKYSTIESIETNPAILSPLLSYPLFSEETKRFTSQSRPAHSTQKSRKHSKKNQRERAEEQQGKQKRAEELVLF
jgi:hypothetical protein